ncbi:MAG TPA: site-2 protease family protein [Papillibacter sp.]|jgi:Zn-dependent protease|nr:site-2 protease family protein [Papillibacter sp.]
MMGEVLRNLDWSVLENIVLSIIPALICIILHEISHGVVAYWLGDPTAKNAGRLSLNPIRHLDVIGLLLMATVGYGWAKPVPIDPRHFKNPKRGMALTALAGPVTNILITVVMLFLYGLLIGFTGLGSAVSAFFATTVVTTAYLSLSLAVFNMLPIPPMDGSKVLFSLASDETYFKLMRYERFGLILILILSVSGKLWGPLGSVIETLFGFFFGIAQKGYELATLIV